MAVDGRSFKRTSTTAEFETPVAKKQNFGPLRHHKPSWDLSRSGRLETPCQDELAMQALLTRSITLALDAVGFEAAESTAIESFRVSVEEYMTHFLADVRRSMLSSRRTQAIPQDFLQSLHTHQLSLRALIPHLDPPVSSSRSQFSLDAKEEQPELSFSGPPLIGISDAQSRSYIPQHFPPFPSTHTYKATPEIPERERDPRKIRELAMEEGRVGEEALRRFLSAGSDRIYAAGSKTAPASMSIRSRRDDLWKETMLVTASESNVVSETSYDHRGSGDNLKEKALGNGAIGKGHLSSAVNSDRRYWRRSVRTQAPKGGQENEII
ncbi:hypothetical protein MMC07_006638 [Pseudocyphellaria aurata]|nr:hypothetical protein [Pseudocyphellaria aurata]